MSSPSEEARPAGVSRATAGAPPGAAGPPEGPSLGTPQRLHPAVLAVWALGGVRSLVVLLIAGSFNLYLALTVGVVAAVAGVARWWRFRWHLEGDALVIEQGLLQQQRRVLPLERIQSVERVRKLGHRLFGVVELRVESIGSGSTEGQLDALEPEVAERLRERLLGRAGALAGQERPADGDRADGGRALVAMQPGRLVVAGLTGARVGVFAAIVGFGLQALGDRVDALLERLFGFVGGSEPTSIVTVVVLVGGTALVVAFVLSVLATTLAFWDFRLTGDDRNLYTTRGLLDQRSGTIPRHRVQSVRIEENLVRRGLGLAAVKVEVAGQVGDGGQETATVLPIGARHEALELAATILERPDVLETPLQPMPPGARDRRLVRAAAATLALTAPAVWWFGPPGAAALLLAVPFALLGLAAYRALGHAAPDGLVLSRSGVLLRVTHMTPERSLQAVSVSSTPLQRRRRLATLTLHIARSPGGGGDPSLVDLADEVARAELARLAVAAHEATRRRPDAAGPVVRAATAADEPAVRRVHEAAGVAGGDGPRGARGDLSLVADEDGEVVGHAELWAVPPPADEDRGPVYVLHRLAVHPDAGGGRLDVLLVRGAVAAAAQRGAHRLVAAGAPDLFEPLGFVAAATAGLDIPERPPGRWFVRLLPADDGSARGRLEPPV